MVILTMPRVAGFAFAQLPVKSDICAEAAVATRRERKSTNVALRILNGPPSGLLTDKIGRGCCKSKAPSTQFCRQASKKAEVARVDLPRRVLFLVVRLELRAALFDGAPPRLVLHIPLHGATQVGAAVR